MKVIITLRCCTQLFLERAGVRKSEMADYSWHERMRDFAFGQKPSAKYVKKKKKMSFRSSCLFNTINHKGYI